MSAEFDLEKYLSNGVRNIVKNAVRATMKDPKESLYLAKYAIYSKAAEKKRRTAEERGEHIPPFLIASITSSCNLHCAGCYSRANHACSDAAASEQLTDKEWGKIFEEARELGIGFILLAGGEPLLRRDVLKAASEIPEVLFPIFTNGTMIDREYLELWDEYRNLVPVFSIEGRRETTDNRRGEGVYDRLQESMALMSEKHLTFGISITLTTENMEESTSDAFLGEIEKYGTKVVFFIEFVPITEGTGHLAFGEKEREWMRERVQEVREKFPEMLFICFPGDEKSSGGCLAAGRGFFHINSHGGAEPCPFSPYTDINVRDTSLKEALQSKLFRALQEQDVLADDHNGGCVLFEKKEFVENFLFCKVLTEQQISKKFSVVLQIICYIIIEKREATLWQRHNGIRPFVRQCGWN